ncbi:MAG: hypothetical protein R3A10_17505 [Caldilineaceae bacterium]
MGELHHHQRPRTPAARAWYAQGHAPLHLVQPGRRLLQRTLPPRNLAGFDGYLDKLCVTSYCYEELQRLDRVEQLAAEKGLTIPRSPPPTS